MASLVHTKPINILQVSIYDRYGGAEKIAWDLFDSYQNLGHHSWLVVGNKTTNNNKVLEIPRIIDQNIWRYPFHFLHKKLTPWEGKVKGVGRVRPWLKILSGGRPAIQRALGYENFDFPGSWKLLELPEQFPDIVHAHNLHGNYFDLRMLPWLSHTVPTVLTLHDAWLFSGHCSHSFGCERWETGCGHCPDLSIYPAIQRDATAYNWRRKRKLFSNSNLYIATPSHWLMKRVERSILAPSIREARIIPNGVNLSIFHPADKWVARSTLGMSTRSKILLFAANGILRSRAKDYKTLRTAVAIVSEHLQDVQFIALGENAQAEKIGKANIHFIPYQTDPAKIAQYYQAADLYLHAANEEVWGLTITEALASGTPVVATAVGGIVDQIKGLRPEEDDANYLSLNKFEQNEATGGLVPARDAEGMAKYILRLLKDEPLYKNLSENAAQDARNRFDIKNQANQYLNWYNDIRR